MHSVSPVFGADEVSLEVVCALDQPQYEPLIILPIDLHLQNEETGKMEVHKSWGASVRFRFTEEERAAIAAGSDLIITELLFGKAFTPLNFQFCKADEKPEF